jgi:hypothetical protein
MRFLLTLALVFTYLTSIAQSKNLLYGNWIKTRLTYQSGKEPTDDTRKFEYLKFSFSQDGKFALAYNYDYKGGSFRFVLNGDTLQYGANLVHR